MSRGILRTLFTALVLALALAAAAPSEAAGARRSDPSPSLMDVVQQWIVSLFEKIGMYVDPNGSGGTATTDGEGGDIGMYVDPNG